MFFSPLKSACPSECLNTEGTDFANIGIESCSADACICKSGYNGTCVTCDLGYVDVDTSATVDCQSTILRNFRQLYHNILIYYTVFRYVWCL